MTLDYHAIEQAVKSETNAGEFADLMRTFRELGVQRYDYLVADGRYRYYDADSHIDLQMNGVPQPVAATSNAAKIKAAVLAAQAGQFDFTRFCQLAGEAGIPVWTSDLMSKTVSYYDHEHHVLLAEPIPGL
ncbi:envelope protein [Levilactobacillus brevis]|uniref:DUF1398 family protein n=1 Tax=Levilactobacillus brevis TaxID=1580 RepID=UPI0007F87955|nr:DUF1398 family protein [Levilactobacillus brevis]ANN47831.1 envelope protein [Levilactobacillus brevis]